MTKLSSRFSRIVSLAVRASSIVAVTAIILLAGTGFYAPVASADTTICAAGSALGKCTSPQGVAVDTETGHLYVADSGNGRIDVFDESGSALSPFGEAQLTTPTWVAVDNDATSPSHHDIYVGTENFELQKFKPSGEFVESLGGEGNGVCQIASTSDPIAVSSDGVVDIGDSYDKDGEGPGKVFVSRIVRFDAAGNCLAEVPLSEGTQEMVRTLAVDSLGNFYVTMEGALGIRKYSPTGAVLNELDPNGSHEGKVGLAIDPSNSLFAKEMALNIPETAFLQFITEYDPAGQIVRRFSYSHAGATFRVPGLAFHQTGLGELYVSDEERGVKYLTLPKGPAIVPGICKVKTGKAGSVRATLQAEVNPEGKATTVKVKYTDGIETKETTPVSLGGNADFELHEAAVLVEGLKPETTYHCKVIAENIEGSSEGEEGSFETKEGFEFGPASVAGVGEEVATVNAAGNPLGLEAMAVIEYVTDAQYRTGPPDGGFAQARVATAELDYGDGEAMQLRSATLTGLAPATTYHWRLHVKNGVPLQGIVCPRSGPEPCPANEHVFRTFGAFEGADGRAWELVSPGQKNSAEVVTPTIATGVFEERNVRIQASAGSGEAATYTSFTSFGKDAEGAPSSSQFLSRRTPGGWVTEDVSPFGFQEPVIAIPFKGFSPELGLAAFKVSDGALAPGCPEGVENLYLLDSSNGRRSCLTPEVPGKGNIACLVYAGSSEDGSRAFFASGRPYAGVPEADGLSLYEWSAAEGLKPVGILPGHSEPQAPTEGTSFGPSLGPASVTNCQWGQTVMRHVVSADGSKAFWTYLPENEAEPSLLLAHVHGAATVQLDASPEGQKKELPGAGPFGNGVFRAASADGSVVYFTAAGKLISGSKAEAGKPDLYRYEFGKSEPLSDLTKSTAPANVQGVIGASDDGSVIYFVAKGVLSGGETNPAGEKAEVGKDNLYVLHGKEARFIAQLAPEDQSDWASQPKLLSARVAPDGQHLAFLSVESQALAGYNNTVAKGEHCEFLQGEKAFRGSPLCTQGFVYDAGTDTLSCATCNPTDARPSGPTVLPGWSNVYEGPRYLSDDGSRFFFESFDAIAKSDENGKRDVYEFERPGAGSCTVAAGSFDPAADGCHFLVSSGRSQDESYLVDASSSGRDVFFATREALVGRDTNPNYDVYDYREGGGFPEPGEPEVCRGEESCKPPLASPPQSAAPVTPGFTGPGDAKPISCPKGKHRELKKGRESCVKNARPTKVDGSKKKHKRRHHAKKGAKR